MGCVCRTNGNIGRGETVFKLTFVLVLQEQSHKMQAVEEHRVQEDQSESSAASGRERMCRCACVNFSFLSLLRYFLLCVMLEIFSGDVGYR